MGRKRKRTNPRMRPLEFVGDKQPPEVETGREVKEPKLSSPPSLPTLLPEDDKLLAGAAVRTRQELKGDDFDEGLDFPCASQTLQPSLHTCSGQTSLVIHDAESSLDTEVGRETLPVFMLSNTSLVIHAKSSSDTEVRCEAPPVSMPTSLQPPNARCSSSKSSHSSLSKAKPLVQTTSLCGCEFKGNVIDRSIDIPLASHVQSSFVSGGRLSRVKKPSSCAQNTKTQFSFFERTKPSPGQSAVVSASSLSVKNAETKSGISEPSSARIKSEPSSAKIKSEPSSTKIKSEPSSARTKSGMSKPSSARTKSGISEPSSPKSGRSEPSSVETEAAAAPNVSSHPHEASSWTDVTLVTNTACGKFYKRDGDGLNVEYYSKFFDCSNAISILSQLQRELPPYLDQSKNEVKIMGKVYKIPRRQAAFGDSGLSYRFSGVTVPAHPWIPVLQEIRNSLVGFLGEKFNFVLVNFYKDGRDHIGEHRDDERDLVDKSSIAGLSFGQERCFVFKHRDARRKKAERKDIPVEKVLLGHGSLVVMKYPTNMYWYHSLPISKTAMGQRVSLTFRVMKQ